MISDTRRGEEFGVVRIRIPCSELQYGYNSCVTQLSKGLYIFQIIAERFVDCCLARKRVLTGMDTVQ